MSYSLVKHLGLEMVKKKKIEDMKSKDYWRKRKCREGKKKMFMVTYIASLMIEMQRLRELQRKTSALILKVMITA